MGAAMGIMMANVPHEVPVEKAMKLETRKSTAKASEPKMKLTLGK